jgi:hypothetical protein
MCGHKNAGIDCTMYIQYMCGKMCGNKNAGADCTCNACKPQAEAVDLDKNLCRDVLDTQCV